MGIDNSKNPWGRKAPDDKPNPWGSGGGGNSGGGNTPPEFDAFIKKIQDFLRGPMPGGAAGGLGPGRLGVVIGLIVVVLWLASGFYLVSPGENAVITRFGQWTKTQKDPGLGYRIPWPVESADVLNVTVDRRIQIGFADGGAGAKRDIPEESLMLTADANIVDLDLVVLWNIEDARDYLFHVRDQEQTIKKVAESALAILTSLFVTAPEDYRDIKSIDILVIGAGMFPSFKPLIDAISHIAPNPSLPKFN